MADQLTVTTLYARQQMARQEQKEQNSQKSSKWHLEMAGRRMGNRSH